MRLDKQTDYALRVLMHLAAGTDRLSVIDAIAARYRISKAHVAHVVRLLGRAGFVETMRGRLAPGGASIRVGDVVREMENDLGAVERLRLDGGRSSTRRRRRSSRRSTIGDLVAGNVPLRRALA
ncbi:Rrf2 family transcriptional regulator [Amaricoccus sp.]|uniref:RrF2 family transcriptional regulator n=1 Tax=Amaricoccus sp. TaxID=1872485 RepID=UPI001B57A618|nr:Rrf2 family transcriptional regulator [Amaricoccus sp.]MBP7001986.1 Rrf2 family transcriptional regulator [Amaricoccus sp.]